MESPRHTSPTLNVMPLLEGVPSSSDHEGDEYMRTRFPPATNHHQGGVMMSRNPTTWMYWNHHFQAYVKSLAYTAMLYNPNTLGNFFSGYNNLHHQHHAYNSFHLNPILQQPVFGLQSDHHHSQIGFPPSLNLPSNILTPPSTADSTGSKTPMTSHKLPEVVSFDFPPSTPVETATSSERAKEASDHQDEMKPVSAVPSGSDTSLFPVANVSNSTRWKPTTQRSSSSKNKELKSAKPYTCTVCLASYHHKFELNRHIKVSHVRPHRCEHCGKGFGHRNYLRMHVETVHLGRKSYECKYCGKFLSTGGNLNVHVRTIHFGEKKYNCPVCKRSFGQQCNMKTHMRRHAQKDQHQQLQKQPPL